MFSVNDKQTLRELAKQWLEAANDPRMAERKTAWKAMNDLNPTRPLILVETTMLKDYPGDLVCENGYARNAERLLKLYIRQYNEIDDDLVIEPYFRIAWDFEESNYGAGVNIIEEHAVNAGENDLGYLSNFPIKQTEDLVKLKKRTRWVNREKTIGLKMDLEDCFGDILPVRISNFDAFNHDPGYAPWVGNNFIGISMFMFKLLGNEQLMLWMYDFPEKLHELAKYLADDRLERFHWLSDNDYMGCNTDNQLAGPLSYGYVSDLPECSDNGAVMEQTWGWAESQESTMLSPTHFNEFHLPYIAEVAKHFGLVYYGCCEPIDDRFEYIEKAIPNIRKVSVSGWNNYEKAAEMIGKKYVYSRKPTPAFISSKTPFWDLVEKDLDDTISAAKNCYLELLFRDIYDVDNDFVRLGRWAKMAKKKVGL